MNWAAVVASVARTRRSACRVLNAEEELLFRHPGGWARAGLVCDRLRSRPGRCLAPTRCGLRVRGGAGRQ